MCYDGWGLPELKGLSISQPIQQEWEWSCQYGAMHQEYCKECNRCIQHVELALSQGNPSLKRAIEFPECFANKEFKRGIDYGTRTCQEPVSSADECLHAACHLMAHHLRITEKGRLDLLVRTIAVHSALNRAGHYNDKLEDRVKSLIQDLRDQREQHAVLRIGQYEVALNTWLGTIWVNQEGQIENRPKPKHPGESSTIESNIAMESEEQSSHEGTETPKWTWSPLYGPIHKGNLCLDCNAQVEHVSEHAIDGVPSLFVAQHYMQQVARHEYDHG